MDWNTYNCCIFSVKYFHFLLLFFIFNIINVNLNSPSTSPSTKRKRASHKVNGEVLTLKWLTENLQHTCKRNRKAFHNRAAVWHAGNLPAAPEYLYYLWHIRRDVFCDAGNKLEPPTSRLHWQAHIISMFYLITTRPLYPLVIHLERTDGQIWED